jgi:two-component system, chemotaxis family, response regulator Rcp1
MTTEGIRPVEILLVEDNPGDVLLMKEGLRDSGVRVNLSVVNNGEEAILFLQKQGRFGQARRPDLVLLDLNLPKKSGREVLTEIKSDPSLSHIPVVVITTSEAEDDVFGAYRAHANCYVTKPADLDELLSVIRAIEGFWLTVVKLPRTPGAMARAEA